MARSPPAPQQPTQSLYENIKSNMALSAHADKWKPKEKENIGEAKPQLSGFQS
jgi:hypothetical protein